MKTVKVVVTFLVILTVIFFGTGLVVKESNSSSSITINKPLEDTFKMFNNLKTLTDWNPAYDSIEIIDEKPGVTGTVYNITVKHNDQKVSVREKVLAYVENEKVTLFFDREGVIETDDYTFSNKGTTTTITLNSSYQAKTYILGCVLPYFKSNFKKIDEIALANFKTFAEKTTF